MNNKDGAKKLRNRGRVQGNQEGELSHSGHGRVQKGPVKTDGCG